MMVEALMLVLLGVLIMALAALALAPVLWARAARVTADKVRDDVHSVAFDEASEHVSQHYEGELAQRETALRSEIEELAASREKISAEATGRVSALENERASLEETRAVLEQQIAERDAMLVDSERMYQALSENISALGARADALGREAADLGSRAEALSSEIAGLGQSHHDIAQSLHTTPAPATADQLPATEVETQTPPEPQPISLSEEQSAAIVEKVSQETPEPVGAETASLSSAGAKASNTDIEDASLAASEASLSDRIKALRDGVSA